MTADFVPLRQQPSALVVSWVRRLDCCEPDSPEARAIFAEAARDGLADAMREGVRLSALTSETNQGFLALQTNNTMVREQCAVCGHGHRDAETPLWIFAFDTRAEGIARVRGTEVGTVCGACAEKKAVRLRDLARGLAHPYHAELIDGDLLERLVELCAAEPVNLSEHPRATVREDDDARA